MWFSCGNLGSCGDGRDGWHVGEADGRRLVVGRGELGRRRPAVRRRRGAVRLQRLRLHHQRDRRGDDPGWVQSQQHHAPRQGGHIQWRHVQSRAARPDRPDARSLQFQGDARLRRGHRLQRRRRRKPFPPVRQPVPERAHHHLEHVRAHPEGRVARSGPRDAPSRRRHPCRRCAPERAKLLLGERHARHHAHRGGRLPDGGLPGPSVAHDQFSDHRPGRARHHLREQPGGAGQPRERLVGRHARGRVRPRLGGGRLAVLAPAGGGRGDPARRGEGTAPPWPLPDILQRPHILQRACGAFRDA